MKKNNKRRISLKNELKDMLINILLELLKQNNIPIPEPVLETLEKLYGVKNGQEERKISIREA